MLKLILKIKTLSAFAFLAFFLAPGAYAFTLDDLFQDKSMVREVCAIYRDSQTSDHDLDLIENLKTRYQKETLSTLQARQPGWEEKSFALFQAATFLNVLFIQQFDQDVAEKEKFTNQFGPIEEMAWNKMSSELEQIFSRLAEAKVIRDTTRNYHLRLENFMKATPDICAGH